MHDELIHLTDGTTLAVKVNFATLYYIQKSKLTRYLKKDKLSEDDSVEVGAKLIYVILNSNGRRVSFEDAMELIPLDTDEVERVFEAFKMRLEEYKKKQAARTQMGRMS